MLGPAILRLRVPLTDRIVSRTSSAVRRRGLKCQRRLFSGSMVCGLGWLATPPLTPRPSPRVPGEGGIELIWYAFDIIIILFSLFVFPPWLPRAGGSQSRRSGG